MKLTFVQFEHLNINPYSSTPNKELIEFILKERKLSKFKDEKKFC